MKKYYILALTFLGLLCGQLSYGQGVGDSESYAWNIALKEVVITQPCRDWCKCYDLGCPETFEHYDNSNDSAYYYDYTNDKPTTGAGGGTTSFENGGPCNITECASGRVLDQTICQCIVPDPCAETVNQAFDNLIQQEKLADILSKFIGPNAQYQISISMGPIANGVLASTKKFNITFNQDYPNATIASKTVTLIHEYIHAYFNTLESEYKITNDSHIYDNYPYLKAAFVDKTTDPEIAHHNQIAASFIDTMVDVLKTLQPGIVIAGDPNQFYTDMAWGTLQGTLAYDSSNLTPDDMSRIASRRIIERDNEPRGANTPMGTPCNN